MPQPGELYHFPDYVFPDGGQRNKFVLLMGKTRADDWILARTTTQPHGRSHNPPCYLGEPYPGFYIDKCDGLLTQPTWITLNRLDDYDARDFDTKVAAGDIVSMPVELSSAPEQLPSSTNEVTFILKDADDTSVHIEAKSRFIGPQVR